MNAIRIENGIEKGFQWGFEKGYQQGFEKGFRIGCEKGRRQALGEILEALFGPLSFAALAWLEQLPLEHLPPIPKILKAQSLAELGLAD